MSKVTIIENTKKKRDWLNDLKSSTGCCRCNETHPSCLEYHHIDKSTKIYEITRMLSIRLSKKRILEEIAKCILLCVNCHREKHANEAV